MGFKTLAIEKSASDVWKVLSAAKTEFGKYSTVMDTLARQLETAQKTVSQAGTRTRAVRLRTTIFFSRHPRNLPDFRPRRSGRRFH
jgi:DNA recombination protein RmuC